MKNDLRAFTKDLFISEGFWGIYQKLDLTPDVRLDPFRTYVDNGINISHYSYISTLRADRPYEYHTRRKLPLISHLKKGEDSFCRLIVGKLPSIVISRDLTQSKSPLSIEPLLENLSKTKVFSIINLFTPMARVIPLRETIFQNNKSISRGIPLLHIFTEHYQAIEEVPIEEMVLYLKNIIATIEKSHQVLSEEKNSTTMVFHFYNIGANAGASIPHLHSQTLLYEKGGHGWKDRSFFISFEKNKQQKKSYCLGCEHTNGLDFDLIGQQLKIEERIIWKDENWIAFTAYAPERDGHIRLLPKRHVSSLWELKESEIVSLAKALLVVNRFLSKFIKQYGEDLKILPDRNILFRQKHFGFTIPIHMFIDVIPVQQIGGAEMLDDHRLSHIFPEEAAKRMKL
ncbi:MAG: HIT domain-containing protein [Promethearchaeota archaeon]